MPGNSKIISVMIFTLISILVISALYGMRKDIFYKKGHKINKFDLGKDSIGNLILNFKTQKEMQKKMNNMDENIKVILY